MNWKEILNDLSMAVAIIDEAEKSGRLSDLERDLVLDILKRNYTAVRFGLTPTPSREESPKAVEAVAATIAVAEVASTVGELPDEAPEPAIKTTSEPVAENSVEPLTENKVEPVAEAITEPADAPLPEPVAEAIIEPERPAVGDLPEPVATADVTFDEEEDAPSVENEVERTAFAAEEIAEQPSAEHQPPFAEDSTIAEQPVEQEVVTSVRHKIDRQTIRSLYGDELPASADHDEDFYPTPSHNESVTEHCEESFAPAEEPTLINTPTEEPVKEPADEPALIDTLAEEPARPIFTIVDTEIDEDEIAEESVSGPIDMESLDRELTDEGFEPHNLFEITDTPAADDDEPAETPAIEEFEDDEVVADLSQTLGESAPHLTVLGDVVGDGHAVLGESLGAPHEDVASVLGAERVSSLRGAIGLNDRFLLIRDLFGGDNGAYERAIADLDSCLSLEDAMLYIFDNFEWDSESDGAKLLSDLLVRRFR